MNRKAILIAVSSQSNPIPGVYEDCDLWHNFLLSYSGGVWNKNEIIPLKDCNRKTLLAAVNSAKDAHYSLIVFAGHGQSIKTDLPWNETQVFLGNDEQMLECELNPGTPRCTLILDCCRQSPEITESTALIKKGMLHESKSDPVKCRAAYNQSLENAEGGLIKIYSTAIGKSADDIPSFSQHLLYQANEWSKQNYGILTFQQGGALAADAIQKRNPQQIPEYHGGRRLRHFPLAVNIK